MLTPDLDSKPRLIFFKTIFIVFFINTGISVLQLSRKKGWKSIIEILYLVFNPCFQLYLDHNNQGNSVPFFTYVSLQFQSILKNLNKVQSQIKNMESRKLLYFKNTILKEAADHQGYPPIHILRVRYSFPWEALQTGPQQCKPLRFNDFTIPPHSPKILLFVELYRQYPV